MASKQTRVSDNWRGALIGRDDKRWSAAIGQWAVRASYVVRQGWLYTANGMCESERYVQEIAGNIYTLVHRVGSDSVEGTWILFIVRFMMLFSWVYLRFTLNIFSFIFKRLSTFYLQKISWNLFSIFIVLSFFIRHLFYNDIISSHCFVFLF